MRFQCFLAALLLGAGSAMAADAPAPDVDALLQHMARPAPATTAFVEVHFSPLFSRPVIISGEMQYLGPDALSRTVHKPYSEHTEIHGDQVSMARGSAKPRTFSLERSPELKTLVSSFSALLSGNRQQLESSFDLTASGDEAHWSLALAPRDARVRERVSRILVNGAGAAPRCMTTTAPDGSVTVMLMEEAAATALGTDIDRAALNKVCH